MNYSKLAAGAIDRLEDRGDFPGFHVKATVRHFMKLQALELGEMLDTLKLDRALGIALKESCLAEKAAGEWRHFPKHSVSAPGVDASADTLSQHVGMIQEGGDDNADLRREASAIMVSQGVNYLVAESIARAQRKS